ncbi:iron ABC transporter permease [Flavimobilis sp. GY10621]|uniref:Iron ABC transporter permease n=1 Tax=Flavimobilis rhizosphaerae TaxID=2775421 RepID=A0ABR9DPX4_9MICO|nr:iron ABC transporter permease [Flavimobilis rhizosphaerae]MBD9699165.1 iron ABC transporter permease [Flavimobilis rhizosphaerae]
MTALRPVPGEVRVPRTRPAGELIPPDAAPLERWPSLGWATAGRRASFALAAAVPLAFLGLFFVWPVVAMLVRGLTDAAGALDLAGVADVLAKPRTWRVVTTTVVQALAGTAVAVVLGVPGAYVLYRRRFPGRTLVRGLVTVPFVLPSVVVGVAFRALLGPGGPLGGLGLDGTFAAIVCALVFFNYAVVVRTVGGFWSRLDPRAEEAARALGASPARVLRTVTLPALVPAIASAAALVFLFCTTAFGVVMVLGSREHATIETEIYTRTTQLLDLRTAAVLSVLQMLVVAAALLVSARARTARERALALHAEPRGERPLTWRSRTDVLATTVTGLVVVGLLAWPMATLVARSFRTTDGTWTLDAYRRLAEAGPGTGLTVTVWQATLTSLTTAAVAATIAVVVGGLVSFVVSRRPRSRAGRRSLAVLDAVVMLPLGVSAVIVGFGLLVTMTRPVLGVDLRTTGWLLPVAQALVAVPVVVRLLLPVLRAVDPRQHEAAATLGAPPGRVVRTVDLPLVTRPLGLAIGFAFAASLGEFGATSFLARPDAPTLPVVIVRLLGRPGTENLGTAMAAATVLALVTAAVMLLAERLRGDTAGEL